MQAIVLGATKGIGRAVARQLAEAGHGVFLLGRDTEQLERSAADLLARSKSGEASAGKVQFAECDLEYPEAFATALAAGKRALGNVDTIVITAGLFGSQTELEDDLERARRLLTVNFAHTVLFCEHARRLLLAEGGGTLCVLSSVAGDRGRKPVGLYGSSKAGLSHYLESLDHKYRSEGLHTVCIKPGFVRTGMTAGLKPPPFAGDPQGVAKDIVRAITRGTPQVYTPAAWGPVMAVIRRLPRAVMRRINF